MTDQVGRSAKAVIDDAIRENRVATFILYTLAIVFACVGLWVLIQGTVNKDIGTSIFGTISSAFCWPSMTAARRTRIENIAIRLLETPLSRTDTGKEAAEMLNVLVHNILENQRGDGK